MARILTAVPGVILVVFGLREVFRDLFHPSKSGSLSVYLARTIFRNFRARASLLPLAGPLSLVLVILSWVLLLGVGFSLIYFGSFPAEFHLNTGRDPAAESPFWTVLYFSFEMLTTLGLGDIAPQSPWLRMLVSFHALVGFALVTASVSWIVLLFPALARIRVVARRASLWAEAEQASGVNLVDAEAETFLSELALDVTRVRVDLIHFPILYYFYSTNPRVNLAASLLLAVRFAEEARRQPCPSRVRLAAAALRGALDDVGHVLSDRFLQEPAANPDAALTAYAHEHLAA